MRIKNHTNAIRQCVMMLENIEVLIEYRNMSIECIFNELVKSNNYGLLRFISNINNEIKLGADSHDAFMKEIEHPTVRRTFDSEDITFLTGFFSMLGKSDINGQLSNCRLHKEFFKNKLSKLESEEKIKCKSSGTLIVGIGILFTIIII